MYKIQENTLAQQLVETLARKGMKIATAESCTGGLIAAEITDISGSSAVFECGIVSYANSAKTTLLGVEEKLLNTHGPVSEQVAIAMAENVRTYAKADIGISATGIAGPTGGSAEKPVGLVFIGISSAQGTFAERHVFSGNRQDIRAQAVNAALRLALTI